MLARALVSTIRIATRYLVPSGAVGGVKGRFLYSVSEDRSELTLKPGVAFGFRQFYGIVQDLVRGAWLKFIRRQNRSAIGTTTELSEFLFPGSRATLDGYRPILRDLQDSVDKRRRRARLLPEN